MALLQPDKAIYHHPLDTTTESLKSDVWTGGVKPSGTVNLAAAKVSLGMLPKVIYDPDLGTVPDSQGWPLFESNGPAAASVSGGVLTSFTSANNKNQYWRRSDLGSFGDFTTDRFEIEVDLKIITSTYAFTPAVAWRIGWTLSINDANNRGFSFGVSGTGVRMSNDMGPPGDGQGDANSPAFVATTTTDDFHKYRLSVSGSVGRLYKDGSLLTSQATGIANASVANQVTFGDSSGYARADTRLRTVAFPSATLDGTGASYPSVIGSTKLAYTGWMRNPSTQ